MTRIRKVATMAEPSSPSKKDRKRGPAPEPGDEGYKSSTQLRNERKRRKTKEDKQKNITADDAGTPEDPSLRYVANPTAAPIVGQAVSFFKERGHNYQVTVGPTVGWRTVAKLAVRSQAGCLRIGLFVPGTHDILEVPQCQAHHPRINSAVEVLQKKCRSVGIQPFDEKTGEGSLRHVAINIERSTGNQQITLVWNDPVSENDDAQAAKLKELCDTLLRVSSNNDQRLELHSLWVHYNNSWKHSNAIFARDGRWEKCYGKDSVIENLDVDPGAMTVPLEFPPQVFRQGNLDAFLNIIIKIRAWLKEHNKPKHCLELYGGVGTIGLNLTDLCESLVSSDENPNNKKCFETTVSKLETDCAITYQSKNASDMVKSGALKGADLVVVDPPRKGLDDDVVQALCKEQRPKSLVYVSCGFDAFMRDFETLAEDGDWKLDHAEGHVLFPGSDAIETLAFFTR
jgi:23S rRNA (uracil1939-C5)-methyltransferase